MSQDDDFERAAQIKDSLDRLEILEAELKEKEDGKKAAVKKRDYDTAGKLSKEVKSCVHELMIYLPTYPPTHPRTHVHTRMHIKRTTTPP